MEGRQLAKGGGEVMGKRRGLGLDLTRGEG